MAAITQLQLENASRDADDLGQIVNRGPLDADVETRLGQTVKPVAKVIAEIEQAGEQALEALNEEAVVNQTIEARDQTLVASALAVQAADDALLVAALKGVYPVAAAANVPRGLTQASVGAITAGSGGANGTFALAWTGGNFLINPTGSFTVAGGALTAVTITGPGLYIGAAPSVPSPSFAASAGLTGAAVALTSVFLIPSGEGYWVQSADGKTLDRYNNVSGVATAEAGVESIFTSQPAAPEVIIGERTLSADDYHKRLILDIPTLVEDGVAEIRIPSNSVDPQPLGRNFKLYYKGGAAVRFAPDAAGEAQFVGLSSSHLALSTAMHWVEVFQEDINVWRFTGSLGEAGEVLDPGTHGVLLDFADFDTLRQDTGGTIRVTALGQPVFWVKNKGTFGGEAIAGGGGYTIELVDGVYMLVPVNQGTEEVPVYTSWLRLASAAGMNLAELDMMFGCKVIEKAWHAIPADKGFVAFQSATNSGVNRNDGGYVALQGNNQLAWRAGSPAAIASAAGIMNKYPHVVELFKAGNAAPTIIYIDNSGGAAMPGTTNQSNTVTSLSTQAGGLVLGALQGNFPPDNLGQSGAVAWSCVVGGGAILTTDQRNQMRAWVEARTYGTIPRLPELASIEEVEARREVLIENIFGEGNSPPTSLGTVSVEGSPPMTGMTSVGSVERIDEAGYDLSTYIYTPTSPRTDVVILSIAGHTSSISSYMRDRITQPAMTAGIPVVAAALPGGANDATSGSPSQHLAGEMNYDRWFGPYMIAINRMRNRYPGAKIIVVGISGGGWASLLLGALDVRVASSLAFVGWLPGFIHLNRDWEQWLNQTPSFSYEELALLASADGRVHRCVSHEDDGVGFGKVIVESRPPFAAALADLAADLDGTFQFRYTSEDVSTTEDPHAYSVEDQAIIFAEVP